jgi:hypothetical protein
LVIIMRPWVALANHAGHDAGSVAADLGSISSARRISRMRSRSAGREDVGAGGVDVHMGVDGAVSVPLDGIDEFWANATVARRATTVAERTMTRDIVKKCS